MPFKLRKVSHQDFKHFHRFFSLVCPALFAFFLTFLPTFTKAAVHGTVATRALARADGNTSLKESSSDATLLKALDLLFRSEYIASDSVLKSLPNSPARTYFRALVLINGFHDLGDTSALTQAENLWEGLARSRISIPKGNAELYQGLATLQLSYAAGIRGKQIRAANLGRQGVTKLKAFSGIAEAEAAMALYDYYKADLLKGIAWVPFVTIDRSGPLARLEKAIPKSRYLKEIFQTNLLWLYYDQGDFAKGLAIIDSFLDHYPKNRLYRQIKADFLFRKGDIDIALSIHQELKLEYQILGKSFPAPQYLPIGYLSSIGNLIKIYAAQNDKEQVKTQLKIWLGKEFESIMDWLPSSLKSEVNSLKK